MRRGGHGLQLLLVLVCLACIGIIPNILGFGHIEVHFIHYTDDCREHLGTNKCDPMFSFCLSTPQTGLSVRNCAYSSTGESSWHFQDTNDIDMEHLTSIVGHSNPWVVQVDKFLDPSVTLVIRVRDADIIFHDHMQTWGKTVTETIWPTKEQSVWVESFMAQDAYTMRFKIRMYCDPYYFTSTCDKYCKPQDYGAGHYTCDLSTGNKICLAGWQGSKCTEDINECLQGYCVRGDCTNVPGDYLCKCPENYSGKNCSTLMNPCRLDPCKNGGMCYAHPTDHVYVCICPQQWQGVNCEQIRDLCQPNPCANNGLCANSPDGTSYNCTCVYPYAGDRCDDEGLTTIQSSLETITTTTTTSLEPSPTENIETNDNSTESSASHDANVQHLTQEDGAGSFQPWYIAIILAALVVVLIVVIVFFIRRRKRKAVIQSTQQGQGVSYDGSNLAFDNGMYSNTNRNNFEIERQTRQLPPVPSILLNEDLFNPIKPSYAQVSETEGATGTRRSPDSNLKKNSSSNLLKAFNTTTDSLTQPASSRAQTNLYADFKTLRDLKAGINEQDKDSHPDESHYHDLDDITASLHQVNDPDDSSNGTFNYTIQDTPVVSVQTCPYDTPSNNSSIYATPTTNLPDHAEDLIKDNGLTEKDDLANALTPETHISADDRDRDSSDDDFLQEDLEQLRKAVEDNMTPPRTSRS